MTAESGAEPVLGGEKKLRARPEVKEILIASKLKHWSLIGQHPWSYPSCSPARARKNFSRLLAKYPDLGRRLNLTIASAYPPI